MVAWLRSGPVSHKYKTSVLQLHRTGWCTIRTIVLSCEFPWHAIFFQVCKAVINSHHQIACFKATEGLNTPPIPHGSKSIVQLCYAASCELSSLLNKQSHNPTMACCSVNFHLHFSQVCNVCCSMC
jgi:hypothetical protein